MALINFSALPTLAEIAGEKSHEKKTTKKIANAYIRGRWWSGTAQPEYVRIDSDGNELEIIYARLPSAVREYLRRQTVKRGLCWMDNPAIVQII